MNTSLRYKLSYGLTAEAILDRQSDAKSFINQLTPKAMGNGKCRLKSYLHAIQAEDILRMWPERDC